MQIKVERFLTLTAMLASAQVGLAGCGDDGGGTEPATSADAGNTKGTESDQTSEGAPTSASLDAGDDTAELSATLGNSDAGSYGQTAAVVDGGASGLDSGATQPSTPDGGGETWTDASTTMWTDAGGEVWPDTTGENLPNATGEDWPDTTGEDWVGTTGETSSDTGSTCVADPAAEGAVIACVEAFGGCNYETYAATSCYNAAMYNTANYFDVFWDCYTNHNVEDPCGEAADVATSACLSFATESACENEVAQCAALAENCSEVTLESCQNALLTYNSSFREDVRSCAEYRLSLQAGPDYEGCGYDFYNCVDSPFAE